MSKIAFTLAAISLFTSLSLFSGAAKAADPEKKEITFKDVPTATLGADFEINWMHAYRNPDGKVGLLLFTEKEGETTLYSTTFTPRRSVQLTNIATDVTDVAVQGQTLSVLKNDGTVDLYSLPGLIHLKTHTIRLPGYRRVPVYKYLHLGTVTESPKFSDMRMRQLAFLVHDKIDGKGFSIYDLGAECTLGSFDAAESLQAGVRLVSDGTYVYVVDRYQGLRRFDYRRLEERPGIKGAKNIPYHYSAWISPEPNAPVRALLGGFDVVKIVDDGNGSLNVDGHGLLNVDIPKYAQNEIIVAGPWLFASGPSATFRRYQGEAEPTVELPSDLYLKTASLGSEGFIVLAENEAWNNASEKRREHLAKYRLAYVENSLLDSLAPPAGCEGTMGRRYRNKSVGIKR